MNNIKRTRLFRFVRRHRQIFAAVGFLLFFSRMLFAGHLPVRIYTSADGLGSSFVDSMLRDSRGFMWFCTRDGLSRFDGSRFVTYKIGEKSSPPGIEAISETRNGIYWISTTGGLFRFDPSRISPPDAITPRINAEYVTGYRGNVFEDSQGNIWLSSGGILKLEQKDGKDVFEKVEWDLPPQLDTTFVSYHIFETNDGSLWFNTSWGLIRRLPDKRTIVYRDDKVILGGSGAMSALLEKTGRIWLTRGNQILVIKPEAPEALTDAKDMEIKSLAPTSVFEIKPNELVPVPKKSGEIYQLTNPDFIEKSAFMRTFQTSDGNIWITAQANLLEIANGILRLHSADEGLSSAMGRMGEDAAGNLWIGGYSGLARLDRHGMVSYGVADGAESARFFVVNEDAAGTLYFANSDSTISRFNGTRFENAELKAEPNPKHLWMSRYTFIDSTGDWWFLTDKKLHRFSGIKDFSEIKGKAPTRSYTVEDGLKSNGMFQIFEDSDGDIWVSSRGLTKEGHGLARLKKGADKFHPFTAAEGFPAEKSPSSITQDRNGNVWFGLYEGGLVRFDGDQFEVFEKGLPDAAITDLHLDAKGRLWISSAIDGLFRIDDTSAKTPVFVNFTNADGLASNNARTITEDRFGRIYVGTARGVDRITPDTGRVKHYSVTDGLAADFVVDSHCDKNGNLWFVTNDGISQLVPLSDEKARAPQILLGGLRIAGVEQEILELGSQQIEKGELSYTENNFQIDFFGLDFRAGETLRYQYKLEGADNDWSPPTELRNVTFANLQPASYRFLVRAVNSDGTASENPAVVSFKILPPIWARWWFIVICALFVTSIILLLYRYRTARLREINLALEEAKRAEENLRKSKEERLAELEKVRSRIATDLHDDIGASLTQIAVLSEVARAQGKKGNGASAEPLSRISDVSNELVEAMSDIVWAINPAKDHLSDLTQRMRRFASDILSAKGIAFHFQSNEADREIVLSTNLRREVFLLFKETVNNIVKHSDAKHVAIELKIASGNLKLKITDDGKGFEMSANGAANSDDYGGNGILSMKKRALEMNGKVEISSAIGKGASVELTLPLEQFSAV